MKKILVLFLLILLIASGCNVEKKDNSHSVKENTDNEGINNGHKEKIYQGYQELLDNNERPEELISYIKDNIWDLNIDTRDKMIDELILTQGSFLEEFNNRLVSAEMAQEIHNYSLQELNNPTNIGEEQLKEFIEEVKANGYVITSGEGVYIEIDPQNIIDQFGGQLSEEMNEYLSIMGIETYKHFAIDGGMAIDWDELADRIVRIEKYLNKYEGSIHQYEMDYLHNIYRRAYVAGIDNSSVFISHKGEMKLSSVVKESYDRTLEKYEGTKIHDLITEYISVLNENDYKKTIAVERFIEQNTSLGY